MHCCNPKEYTKYFWEPETNQYRKATW